MKLPLDCVLAVTYKCNAKCQMCDIWKIKEHSEINASEFLKLPKSLKYINISGGEPFLRKDLVEIIKNVKKVCPKSKLIISSNGLAIELIKNKIKEILKIDPCVKVAISIDGIGQVHNKIRGVPGGFEMTLKTLKSLKSLKNKNLKIAFTLTNDNLYEMRKVYDLSKELDVEFTMSAMQSSDIYFGNKETILQFDKDKLKHEFDYIINQELKTWSLKKWLRAYYSYGLYKFIIGRGRELPIEAGDSHFFMDPKGNIYPSVVDSQLMGNVSNAKIFEQLWFSEENNELRKRLKQGLAKPSWMICTVRMAMRKYWWKVGWWILKSKKI